MELDKANGNTLWADAEAKEIGQILEYKTFKNMGKGYIPTGYQKIKVHLVYDVKPDGRRKARLVAAGYMVDAPLEGVYSSVVSLRGLRMCLFIGELNYEHLVH